MALNSICENIWCSCHSGRTFKTTSDYLLYIISIHQWIYVWRFSHKEKVKKTKFSNNWYWFCSLFCSSLFSYGIECQENIPAIVKRSLSCAQKVLDSAASIKIFFKICHFDVILILYITSTVYGFNTKQYYNAIRNSETRQSIHENTTPKAVKKVKIQPTF